MPIENFDVQEWTRQHAQAFRAEILEVAHAALGHVDISTGKRARVLVRPRRSREPWRPLDCLTLDLLAAALSAELGRKVGPKYLRRMLEHAATAFLLMPIEQFWNNAN